MVVNFKSWKQKFVVGGKQNKEVNGLERNTKMNLEWVLKKMLRCRGSNGEKKEARKEGN